MAKRTTTSTSSPTTIAHKWTAVEEWNGFAKGDPIVVSGERGDFKFLSAHVVGDEAISIIVHGGVYGHVTMRAFYPNRVSKPRAKKSRKAEAA